MLTNEQYGKRIRERQKLNRLITRTILGKDKKGHVMTIKRKAGSGIGNFADITKPMTAERLAFIRKRAIRTSKEAIQRQWILSNPFNLIRKRVCI